MAEWSRLREQWVARTRETIAQKRESLAQRFEDVDFRRDFKRESRRIVARLRTQQRRLQMLGVIRGQGYLFGKPEPVDLALEKLGEEEMLAVKEIFDQF